MIINCIITVLEKDRLSDFLLVCRKNEIAIALSCFGEGTAEEKYLHLYELEDTQKAVVVSLASEAQSAKLRREARRRLMMDIPGNGIMLTVPVKSISGASLDYLGIKDGSAKGGPDMAFENELIFVILNRGYVDEIVSAAREAGATGGTVIHAVGTLGKDAATFLGIQISSEKDILMLATDSARKKAIMQAIARKISENEEINGIVLSVPVSDAIGLRRAEE